MNERTMLERAARAMGDEVFGVPGCYFRRIPGPGDFVTGWDPLTDHGCAFRLAAKLHLVVDFYEGEVISQLGVEQFDPNDIDAACLAIVRAAASLADQDGQAQAGGV